MSDGARRVEAGAAISAAGSARREATLWIAQRASALVLAVCVVVHLVTIVYAVRGGLSAAEILSRTRGHTGWFLFYGVFVLAAAVHAPIGLRDICSEWLGWRRPSRDAALVVFALLVAGLGLRAAWGLYA